MALFSLENLPIGVNGGSSNTYIAAVSPNNNASTSVNFRGRQVDARPITQTTGKGNNTIINICDSFDWTATPIQNSEFDRKLITRGEIKEYRMADDSVIKAILYNTEAITSGALNVAQNVAGIVTRLSQNYIGDNAGSIANSLGTAAVNGLESTQNLLKSVGAAILKEYNPQSNAVADSKEQWMIPYNGLYALEATDFRYILPYLENRAKNFTAAVQDINFPPLQFQRGLIDTVSMINTVIAPGQYVEKPYIYDPQSSSKPSVTFRFPLINTNSFEGAVKNYQFLWLLVYQNMPYRVSKSLLELPKLYEVNVPGVEYMRYSYVTSLEINFIGNRRHVDIPMPGSSIGLPSTVNCILPDAYEVAVTFQSLTTRSSNMMLQMLKNSNPAA